MLDRRQRTVWLRSPVTRCPTASGAYDRSKERRCTRQSIREALDG